MKYMVMECHPGYAVVLDEEGRFRKVANRQYEVGQTVAEVIGMEEPDPAERKKKAGRWIGSLAAAACLILAAASTLRMGQAAYASVYMTINPEVRIDVDRDDVAVGLEGLNADGKDLVEGFRFQEKSLDTVMDELLDRAADRGYLHEGIRIVLTLDAEDGQWIADHSESLPAHVNEYLTETLSVTIEVTDEHVQEPQAPKEPAPEPPAGAEPDQEPEIPKETVPDQPAGTPSVPDSDYGESDYGEEEAPLHEERGHEGNHGDREWDGGHDDSGYGKTGDSDYDD